MKMHTSSKLRKEFIKKWVKGLRICCSSKKYMDILQRKKKIKLCADIALASAKNATTLWSIALISKTNEDDENKILVDNLLGPDLRFKTRMTNRQMIACDKRVRSKTILKKSRHVCQKMKKMGPPKSNLAAHIAKKLVKRRTQMLKRLVPGGESMDEFSLIKEALDYILSLRIQVGVMRTLANANEVLNQSDSKIID